MSYLTQLESIGSSRTKQRKKEYILYNFGKYINPLLRKKKSSVLELGPGIGDCVEYFQEHGAKYIDIVEKDKSVATYIKKTYNVRTVFQNDDVTKIKKRLGKYDVIMMTQVLEHIHPTHHLGVIRTLYEHLNYGGCIIITVPNIGNPLATFERYYNYTHETAFTEHSLEQMVDYAHLIKPKIILQPFSIPPYSPINGVRKIFQTLLHVFFKLFYIINGGVYPKIVTTNISLIIKKNE